MSWIKIRTDLATDPCVSAIASKTKIHPRQAVGCLVAIWCWADTLTDDGAIPHASEKQIDEIAGKKGFANAMASVSWLSIESGRIVFPKWDRHHSQSAKARAGETERKRIARESGTPVRKMSGQTSGQSAEQIPDQRRGEEIREEYKTEARVDESTPASVKPIKPAAQAIECDAEWLASLVGDCAYAHVNISSEHSKMMHWCEVNRKRPSRRRFVNWINRIERPMNSLFSQPVRVQT